MAGWLGKAAHLLWRHETPRGHASSSASAEALVLSPTAAAACQPPRTGLTPPHQNRRPTVSWSGWAMSCCPLAPASQSPPAPRCGAAGAGWEQLLGMPWQRILHSSRMPSHALPSSRQAHLSAMQSQALAVPAEALSRSGLAAAEGRAGVGGRPAVQGRQPRGRRRQGRPVRGRRSQDAAGVAAG